MAGLRVAPLLVARSTGRHAYWVARPLLAGLLVARLLVASLWAAGLLVARPLMAGLRMAPLLVASLWSARLLVASLRAARLLGGTPTDGRSMGGTPTGGKSMGGTPIDGRGETSTVAAQQESLRMQESPVKLARGTTWRFARHADSQDKPGTRAFLATADLSRPSCQN